MGVHEYTEILRQPGQPLKLVDSTGFSLQSIRGVLAAAGQVGLNGQAWNADSLFAKNDGQLRNMMGVLIGVPELRDNFKAVTGGSGPDGARLALIIKDWVNGASIPDLAGKYFMGDEGDINKAITACGQNLFGRLTQTTAWGLGALLSITGSSLPDEQFRLLNNLPSRVYYGVNDDAAVALRLLGVPRGAATRLARLMQGVLSEPLNKVRGNLHDLDDAVWRRALGEQEGKVYRNVWRVLEGLD